MLFGQTIIHANETPENVLKKYNDSITPDEIKHYLTGLIKDQFRKLDKEQQQLFIKYNRMKNYEAQTVSASDELQFVFVYFLEYAEDSDRGSPWYPIIYEFHKVRNEWKISNLMSGHIIIDLFKQNYPPEQFHTTNSFQFEGKRIQMESAFAYFKKTPRRLNEKTMTTVTIRFYPFEFQAQDVEYFKYNFGWVVEEIEVATTIASSFKYPIGELTLYLDNQNKIVSFCLNGYNIDDRYGSFNYCRQENLFNHFNF